MLVLMYPYTFKIKQLLTTFIEPKVVCVYTESKFIELAKNNTHEKKKRKN